MFKNSLSKFKSLYTQNIQKQSQSAKNYVKSRSLFGQQAKKNFSTPGGQSELMRQYAGYAMVGAGTAGLMYLVYQGQRLSTQRYQMPMQEIQQMHFFNNTVQQRIRTTMGYFTGGLFATGLMVGLLRNSMVAYTNPWLLLFGSLGLLIGTQMTDYYQSSFLKHALWGGFISTMALSLVPLISMAGMPVVYDAVVATGITMAGLGVVAYNAPSEQFLKWGGPLGMALAGMIGLGFANMFWPNKNLFNIWLYGGLILFGMFVMYDTQQIIYRAKINPYYDPINESLSIYLDAIMIFQRFLIIFLGRGNKK
eukprot:403365263